MHLSHILRQTTFALSLAATVTAGPTAGFKAEDTITRDVYILGGGATGTYAAVGHSVAVIEKQDRLGRYFNNEITKRFFRQVDIDYEPLLPASVITENVNFETGDRVLPGNGLLGTVVGALLYRTAIEQFDYLSIGAYYLPDEVPEVLLRPFREFVETYSLQGAMGIIFTFAQNVGDILDFPLLYVIQNFGIPQINALLEGGYIRPRNGTAELFNKAANYIDEQNIFYQSTASQTKRDSSGVEITVQSADGTTRLIKAKKLLIAFPPTLPALNGFDLRDEESSLFAKWHHNNYYAASLTNTGLPDGINVSNTNPSNQPGSLPLPPFEWELQYTDVPGYFMTKIVANANFTADDAKNLIKGDFRRMRETGVLSVNEPEIAAFANHSPETLTVSADDIRNGFYKTLYGLQGQYSTFYTGYTFCTDYSSPLWNYTSAVLDMMDL